MSRQAIQERLSDGECLEPAAAELRADFARSSEILFWAVVQLVGFGLGKSKMSYFSMGID